MSEKKWCSAAGWSAVETMLIGVGTAMLGYAAISQIPTAASEYLEAVNIKLFAVQQEVKNLQIQLARRIQELKTGMDQASAKVNKPDLYSLEERERAKIELKAFIPEIAALRENPIFSDVIQDKKTLDTLPVTFEKGVER
jgi:hypothetical protein